MLPMPDIWFPYLGIEIEHSSKIAFTIGNLSVAWYGVLISCGVICGLLLARVLAKKSGQDPDFYTDFLIYALIIGLLAQRRPRHLRRRDRSGHYRGRLLPH